MPRLRLGSLLRLRNRRIDWEWIEEEVEGFVRDYAT
jgi:hypothetical protein